MKSLELFPDKIYFKIITFMKHVIDAFDKRPIAVVKGSRYLINPLTDHYPTTTYELLDDTVEELSKLTDYSKATKLLGEEDRGGFLCTLLAYKHKKAFGMAKWNPLDLVGQHEVEFRNAYAEGKMYIYGVEKGDKVIIVEDMVDSGGTIIALVKLLQKIEVEILDIVTVAVKTDYDGLAKIKAETGFDVKYLLEFTTKGETSAVIKVNHDS